VLSALRGSESHLLSNKGTLVQFRAGTIVCELGDHISHAYFLRSGVASLLAGDENGALVEVAMVGCEGVLGAMPALALETSPFRIVIPSGGAALRVRIESVLQLFHDSPGFRKHLTQYLGFLFFQVNVSALCNCAHSLDGRLARWLMICGGHLGADC